MGSSVFPAPSSGKTRYLTTLTGGTSWTVPAGVTYVNVTLRGGGGGGTGGGAVSMLPLAIPGSVVSSIVNTTPGSNISYSIGAGGAGGAANFGAAGTGGTTTFTGATSAPGGAGGINYSTNAVPPVGATGAAYQGAGNGGMHPYYGSFNTGPSAGGPGGSGSIDIEYWV